MPQTFQVAQGGYQFAQTGGGATTYQRETQYQVAGNESLIVAQGGYQVAQTGGGAPAYQSGAAKRRPKPDLNGAPKTRAMQMPDLQMPELQLQSVQMPFNQANPSVAVREQVLERPLTYRPGASTYQEAAQYTMPMSSRLDYVSVQPRREELVMERPLTQRAVEVFDVPQYAAPMSVYQQPPLVEVVEQPVYQVEQPLYQTFVEQPLYQTVAVEQPVIQTMVPQQQQVIVQERIVEKPVIQTMIQERVVQQPVYVERPVYVEKPVPMYVPEARPRTVKQMPKPPPDPWDFPYHDPDHRIGCDFRSQNPEDKNWYQLWEDGDWSY